MTDNLPTKLREQAAIRKSLGAHPYGYQYLLDAADELEALREWKLERLAQDRTHLTSPPDSSDQLISACVHLRHQLHFPCQPNRRSK